MIITLDKARFVLLMHENEYNPFSANGLSCLFDMIEEYEESSGYNVEIDPTAFRCQYVEYENFHAIYEDYDNMIDLPEDIDCMEFDEVEQIIENYISEIWCASYRTFNGGVILDTDSF